MFTEGSPGGIQKSYSKRLEQGLGVPRVMLSYPPIDGLPSHPDTRWSTEWSRLIQGKGGVWVAREAVYERCSKFTIPIPQPGTRHENRMNEDIVFFLFQLALDSLEPSLVGLGGLASFCGGIGLEFFSYGVLLLHLYRTHRIW